MFGFLFCELITSDGRVEFETGSFFKTLEGLGKEEYSDFLRFFGIEPEEQKVVGNNYYEGRVLAKEEIFQILMDNNFLVKKGFLAKIRARLQLRKFLKRNYSVPGFDHWRYVFRLLPKNEEGIPNYQLTKEFSC